jgi:hypothetical protein
LAKGGWEGFPGMLFQKTKLIQKGLTIVFKKKFQRFRIGQRNCKLTQRNGLKEIGFSVIHAQLAGE